MRLGIDLNALQLPSCRNRGIGRFAKSLIRELVIQEPAWDLVFYVRHDLELDWDHDLDDRVSQWVTVGPDPRRGTPTLQTIIDRNVEELDWFLTMNPLGERCGYQLPEPRPGGPRLATVVHDLIPVLFPSAYLSDARFAREYAREIRRIQAYDLFLNVSDATRRDVLLHLGVPAARCATILEGNDSAFFHPAGPGEDEADTILLREMGIEGEYLYYVGNTDPRKYVLELLDAYALMPRALRDRWPLVLTAGTDPAFVASLFDRVHALQLDGSVKLTGHTSDQQLRALYRRCTLFLFPSLYEGFGLPILEAMSCGAAVVIADNSAQPEVAGDAGVQARTGDAADWASKIAELLLQPDRIADLRTRARIRSSGFTWGASARRVREAIAAAPPRERIEHRLAIVPIPSATRGGFAPESDKVFQELSEPRRNLVFHSPEHAASLPRLPVARGWQDLRVIEKILPLHADPTVIYVVDTLAEIETLLEALRIRSGVVAFANAFHHDLDAILAGGSAKPNLARNLIEMIAMAKLVTCASADLRTNLIRFASEHAHKIRCVTAAEHLATLAEAV